MSDRSREAKTLTIMMTEVVGSTGLWRAHGDRDADDILRSQATIVYDQVTAFGGRVRKSMGDGFLISFPSTVARSAPSRSSGRCTNTTSPIRSGPSRPASAFIRARSPSTPMICKDRPCTLRPESWRRRSLDRSSPPTRFASTPSRRWTARSSIQGCFGCEASRSAGGCTRCPGAIPQRAHGRALGPRGLRRSSAGMQSEPACDGSWRARWPGMAVWG